MNFPDQDLTFPRGVDHGVEWPLYEGDQPADLFGWTGVFQIRADRDTDSPLLAVLPVAVLDGGLVTAQYTAEQSNAWGFDFAYYDLMLISPSGRPSDYLARGTLVVSQNVSEAA